MPIPTPEPGLVISYSYVWDDEARTGQEEGRKGRPCVVVLVAVPQRDQKRQVVTVLPVTHRAPDERRRRNPARDQKASGARRERSWIVVSEGDQFVWPGYDLRKVRGSSRYDHGFLPPRFFERVMTAFLAWRGAHKTRLVPRG